MNTNKSSHEWRATPALARVLFGCALVFASIMLGNAACDASDPAVVNEEAPIQTQDRNAPAPESAEQEAVSEEPMEPVVDPEADAVLKAMAEYLGTARTFSFHAEVTTEDVILTNIKIQTTASLDIGLRRPNGLYAEYSGDVSQRRTWFDGENFTLLDGVHNVYGVIPVPTSLDKTLKELRDKYGAKIPMSFLVINNPYTEIMEYVKYGFYIGLRNVEGTRCHHLAYVTENVHFQLWVEDGAQFVPRKLVVTYRNEPEAPQYTAIFSDWDFSPRLAKYLFIPKIPADAVKIDFLELQALKSAGASE